MSTADELAAAEAYRRNETMFDKRARRVSERGSDVRHVHPEAAVR